MSKSTVLDELEMAQNLDLDDALSHTNYGDHQDRLSVLVVSRFTLLNAQLF